jgi:acetyl esterase/lipase
MTRPARDFALEFNAVVVSATYRLAPEHKFPTPMQDAWDTLVWLSQRALDFGADPTVGFVVGGVSAGGTMAAVLTQLAKDRVLNPPLTGSWVSIPLLLVKEIVPLRYTDEWTSMEANKDNESLNRDTIRNIIRTLAPDVRSPLFSPFNSQTPHVGLPATYVQVGGLDVLRDDGLILAKALRENGVPTRCDLFDDLGHAAWTIYTTAYSRVRLGPKTMEGMRWLLSRGGIEERC